MSTLSDEKQTQIELTAEIVAAFVSRNSVPASELPALIKSVFGSVSSLGTTPAVEADFEPLKPAVPIKKSITEDYIISLEDGRKLKSMKRYLAGIGMTPAEYRAKWGLPGDYPMVAPAYARHRSELAKTAGLGRSSDPRPAAAAPVAPVAENAPSAPKRARKAA